MMVFTRTVLGMGAVAATLGTSLMMTIDNIRPEKGGRLLIALCTEETYGQWNKCQQRAVAPSEARVTVPFNDLEPGSYAASVVHDTNGNQALDFNFVGEPSEGFAASNNPAPRMGPALFDDAAFEVPASGTSITIDMVYVR